MSKVPCASYRLQLHAGFTLDDAAAQISYLAQLGISHLYASPYLQAAPGSTHGYDVMDPTQVNQELGGQPAHDRLTASLREHGLGQVLDIVPNHMAISGPQNVWWWDVLENGPSSPYASYFDVEWDSGEGRLGNKILLPILANHYGRILEVGEIRIKRENEEFSINYFNHTLPVAPRSLVQLFRRAAERGNSDQLAFLADALEHLPLPTTTDYQSTRTRQRSLRVIREQLKNLITASPEIAAAIDSSVNEINADPDLLDDLLERQNYRIAFWRTAARDLSYRRFFDINTLVGVRVEDERVLADTHCLILKWLQDGTLDGVRIDHPDGLRDPEQYLRRLRASAPNAWIVVEKILHPGERLPATWPVSGTTGYDFLNILQGIFIEPGAEQALTDFYAEFTGEPTDYTKVAREKKHQVMHLLMGSDINRLTEFMIQICERHRRYRDYTRYEVNEALREIIACFPVYRTYVRPDSDQIRAEDRKVITESLSLAKENRPELESDLFDFIGGLLLREHRGDLESEFICRFQQVTGPITAKGIEDTAFYNFNRMVALNEVGGNPAQFGRTVESFHAAMSDVSTRSPHMMLSTSTHDTKRSEDVRARLAVLTEVPHAWTDAVRRWAGLNEKYRTDNFPDRNAEYLLYQTLFGAWPVSKERILAYMEKAGREAKKYTSWTNPTPAYEDSVRRFVDCILDDPTFCEDIEGFVNWLTWPGRVNALAQTLIKLTAPGVPDTYQGTELWDLSLVDPDNRRPVNFAQRRQSLELVKALSVQEIVARTDEGLPKLWVVHRTLQVRCRFPDLFAASNYQPLVPDGDRAYHVVAFARGDNCITVTPRFVVALNNEWGNTSLELPPGTWLNQFTNDTFTEDRIMLQSLFEKFPVALLVKDT